MLRFNRAMNLSFLSSAIVTTLTSTLGWTSIALAQAAPAATGDAPAAAATPPAYMQFVPFIAIFAIFYFLIIRPQSKRQKDHQSFVTTMKRGDNVVTNSGIFGKINGITDKFVTLEVSEGVNIRILKSQIASSVNEGAANV